MNSAFQLLMIFSIPLSGGSDLLEMVPTTDYWQYRHVPISVQRMIQELNVEPAKDVSGLIAQLGDDKFSVRQQASRKLKAMGVSILSQLKAATKNKDPEIVRRTQELVNQIDTGFRATVERQLMAIRTLGELKSPLAIKPLQKLTKSNDLFLSEYAQAAIAKIENKPFKRPEVSEKELAEDIAILPKDSGLIFQYRLNSKIPLNLKMLEAEMKKEKENLIGRESQPNVQKMLKKIVSTTEKIGNFRVEAITFALTENTDRRVGSFIFVVRGLYDQEAIVKNATETGNKVGKINGYQSISFWGINVIFLSNRRLVFCASSSVEKSPISKITQAARTGKSELAENKEMIALLKKVDRKQSFWLVAKVTGLFKREFPMLKEVSTITLEMKQNKNQAKLVLIADFKDAKKEKIEKAEKQLDASIVELLKNLSQVEIYVGRSTYKPYIDLIKSVKHEKMKNENKVRLTGEFTDLKNFLLSPLKAALQ